MPISSEILQRLKANDPSITSLDLSFQLLTDADVIELCDALKNNDHLVSLNLRGNQITSSGAEALAQSQQIERLILDFNLIDNQGINTLTENTHYKEISIGYNLIDLESQLTRSQKKYCLKHFNIFNSDVLKQTNYFLKVFLNAFLDILSWNKDSMDNDSRTMMMGMTLNRNEHLKGLSLCQQSKNSLFTKLPRELIHKDIFSFLLPQQLIQNFLEARIKSDKYFSEKMLLDINSKLFLKLYIMLTVCLAFNQEQSIHFDFLR